MERRDEDREREGKRIKKGRENKDKNESTIGMKE